MHTAAQNSQCVMLKTSYDIEMEYVKYCYVTSNVLYLLLKLILQH